MGLLRVLAVTVMAMAVLAAPAPAQTSGGNPPDYVLEEDGTVVIDGDAGTDCRSFASFLEQGYFEPPGDPSQQAQSILEQCEEAGFPPAGAVLKASASPVASAGPDGALPQTGGPSLTVPLLAAVAALLATGLLALRGIRR